MKRLLSEKNLAVLLFVFALVFFAFAQQEARKVEKVFMSPSDDVSSLLPASKTTTAEAASSSPEKTVTNY